VEAGQLQLGDRRDDPRSRHDAVDEMIGELGSDRLMREPIGFTLFASSFPVTSQIALWQAMNTTPRLCSAGIVLPAGPNTLLGFSKSESSDGAALRTTSVFVLKLPPAISASLYLSEISRAKSAR
jgi:hypothetical protein